MPLDPQAQLLLDKAKASGLPPLQALSVADARARMTAAFTTVGEREPVSIVRNLDIPAPHGALPARLFSPAAGRPLVVFFHGGGWVVNSVDTHDALCRALANLAGVSVLSVDYRLAPEHPFPAAVEDAWTAVQWAAQNAALLGASSDCLAVAGDSSGATLAAVSALMAREAGGPRLAAQVLAYPVTDHWSAEPPSYTERATGGTLTRAAMLWFWQHYWPAPEAPRDFKACPLRANSLAGLPPTLVLTAEHDPLRDEGGAYARSLSAAGTNTTWIHAEGQMHGFLMQINVINEARSLLQRAAAWLSATLNATP